MAVKRSAGLIVFRRPLAGIEVLLGHLGGPLWAKRDEGAWTIPKGEYAEDEPAIDAARREFTEELGLPVPVGPLLELGEIRQSGGKVVTAWAVEADVDLLLFAPGTFELQWPPRSGRMQQFPELDRVHWFDTTIAASKIIIGQRELIDRLVGMLGDR